jgi:hypothetical protein
MSLAVSSSYAHGLVDKPGGPALREQIQAREAAIKAREVKQLDAAPTVDAREALEDKFIAQRKERGEKYAALLCSQDGWQPKPGASSQSQVLTAYYALLGQKARAYAAAHGRPVSLEDIDRVKLSKDDVEKLRKQFGDEAVKKALPLLQRHMCQGKFLTAAAMRFMQSSQFVVYQTAIEQERDVVDTSVRTHDEKLDEKDHDRLREERHRQVTHWTDRVVVQREDNKRILYASVGGRLVPLGEKPE